MTVQCMVWVDGCCVWVIFKQKKLPCLKFKAIQGVKFLPRVLIRFVFVGSNLARPSREYALWHPNSWICNRRNGSCDLRCMNCRLISKSTAFLERRASLEIYQNRLDQTCRRGLQRKMRKEHHCLTWTARALLVGNRLKAPFFPSHINSLLTLPCRRRPRNILLPHVKHTNPDGKLTPRHSLLTLLLCATVNLPTIQGRRGHQFKFDSSRSIQYRRPP